MKTFGGIGLSQIRFRSKSWRDRTKGEGVQASRALDPAQDPDILNPLPVSRGPRVLILDSCLQDPNVLAVSSVLDL